MITENELVRTIDFAILKPEWTDRQIMDACAFAVKSNVINVCVHANKVALVQPLLKGTDTLIGTVVGFPTGCHTPYIKGKEAEEVVRQGAQEVDMVMDYGALKSQNFHLVKEDIQTVVKACGVDVKVILETAYLTHDEIAAACRIAEESGAVYVKTSTGVADEGATLEKVAVMKASISEKMKIKASGGISDLKTAVAFLEAGCSRLGTSRLKNLLDEMRE